MNADDLTKPLTPMPRQQRRGIVLPIVAATLSGVFSGWLILFDAAPDRSKPLSPASMPQPALAQSVQRTAAVPEPAPAMPTAKTITVIDSKTGARREVVVPDSTDDQSQEGKPAPTRSAATIAPADTVGARGAAKSKRR